MEDEIKNPEVGAAEAPAMEEEGADVVATDTAVEAEEEAAAPAGNDEEVAA
jgi:hypothetical protein